MKRIVLLTVGGLTVPAAAAAAQFTGRIEITGAYVRSRSEDPLMTVSRDGLAAGLRAAAAVGPAGLEIHYAEGRLGRDGVDERDFVDAALLAAVRPRPWLTVLAGPLAHALRDGSGTRRWLFWTGVARAESPRFGRGHASVFGEVWLGIGSVNETDGSQLARGMETGVLAWLASAPLYARLAYRLDDGRLDEGGLRSTVESLALGVGYAF